MYNASDHGPGITVRSLDGEFLGNRTLQEVPRTRVQPSGGDNTLVVTTLTNKTLLYRVDDVLKATHQQFIPYQEIKWRTFYSFVDRQTVYLLHDKTLSEIQI